MLNDATTPVSHLTKTYPGIDKTFKYLLHPSSSQRLINFPKPFWGASVSQSDNRATVQVELRFTLEQKLI